MTGYWKQYLSASIGYSMFKLFQTSILKKIALIKFRVNARDVCIETTSAIMKFLLGKIVITKDWR